MSGALAVTVLTEAGRGVGLGHLRRTQALAAALRARGARTAFLVSGTGAVEEQDPDTRWEPWTQTPGVALRILAASAPDVVVVDSYAVREDFLEVLRHRVAFVVAIDDLAERRLPAHVVVNGAWHAESLAYRGAADTTFLLGPRYVLLDPAFAAPPHPRAPGPVRRLLVSLGGSAAPAAVAATVAAVTTALPEAIVDVVLGPFAPDPGLADGRANPRRGLRSLRSLMLEADLAISGAGMTLYECLAAGTPVVAIAMADNQRPNLAHLAAAGLVVPGEPSLGDVLATLASDPSRRAALSARGRQEVDGGGAGRVAAEIERRCGAVMGGRAV